VFDSKIKPETRYNGGIERRDKGARMSKLYHVGIIEGCRRYIIYLLVEDCTSKSLTWKAELDCSAGSATWEEKSYAAQKPRLWGSCCFDTSSANIVRGNKG
jgi:hypothetical protein